MWNTWKVISIMANLFDIKYVQCIQKKDYIETSYAGYSFSYCLLWHFLLFKMLHIFLHKWIQRSHLAVDFIKSE